MRVGSRRALSIAAIVCLATACRESAPAPPSVEPAPRWLAAPSSADTGELCADVGTLRACWDGAAVLRVPRPVPDALHPQRGFRCVGQGEARRCEDRAHGSSAFDCSETLCTQQVVRMPDSGEWECADMGGVVVCRGGHQAAGVVPAAPDPGWLCGARSGAAKERICIDLSPDVPLDGKLGRCRFEYEPSPTRRLCEGGAPALARACPTTGCPAGLRCAEGHCLPLRPEPGCWLDRDCGGGKCVQGSCRRGPT